jgi:opacity protein-like surface antigen
MAKSHKQGVIMKTPYLISNLGPNLIQDHTIRHQSGIWASLVHSVTFWVVLLGLISCIGYGIAQAADSDPMVMKIYPDGTKVIVRWSEVGKEVDNGEKFGGAPKIVAYDPAKDGVVPIGEPNKKPQTASTNAAVPVPSSSSVVSPEQPAKMDYTNADPKDFEEHYGPAEGFGFQTSVGPAFQQSISYRDISSTTSSSRYNKITFSPGIRFDLEPFYNITDWFGLGIQTAFIYNRVHSITTGDTTSYFNTSSNGNAAYYQIPILLNFKFQFPSEGPVRGYLTGAPGGVWDFSTISTGGRNFTSYQWNYAFQLGAGIIYNVSSGLDLDTSFKMLCTPNPLGENSEAQSKASYNYAATIGLVWRF